MFDQEKRIKQLEKEVAELKSFVKEMTPKNHWLPITDICNQFDLTRAVILSRIHSGFLVHLKDYKKNGKKYLINTDAVKKIM